jgi:hypothetical protein
VRFITGLLVNHSNTAIGYPDVAISGSDNAFHLNVNATASSDAYGVRVGSGSTSPTPSDYNLATLISNGSGSGQLQYGATTVEAVTINGQTTSFRVIRTFSNSSGSTVTVREIGLSAKILVSTAPSFDYVLIARDVLGSAVDVPNGSTLTVRYILSTTT